MMPNAQVLFVTRYFWPELIGSAPFTTDIAEWIARSGRPTTVVSGLPHYPGNQVFAAYRNGERRRETVGTVTVERLRSAAPTGTSGLSRIVNEVDFLVRGLAGLVSGRIRRHPIVLALCPSILSVTMALAARRADGVCVVILHDIQSGLADRLGMNGSWLVKIMRAVERLTLNRVDLVMVLSEEMKAQLRDIGVSAPIEILPLWVDTDAIRPVGPARNAAIKVHYSGNLGRKQGIDQVVAMAADLQNRRPEIEITLRGDGNQIRNLTSQIARLNLDNVRLAELEPEKSLAQELAAADIHLVPQNPRAAAFAVPSKVFNIMAVGRPFVATAFPDSTLGHLQRRSGAFLCVPPDEPAQFADAVLRLADDASLRRQLGERGRAFVEKHNAKPVILTRFASRLDALAINR